MILFQRIFACASCAGLRVSRETVSSAAAISQSRQRWLCFRSRASLYPVFSILSELPSLSNYLTLNWFPAMLYDWWQKDDKTNSFLTFNERTELEFLTVLRPNPIPKSDLDPQIHTIPRPFPWFFPIPFPSLGNRDGTRERSDRNSSSGYT